MANQPEESVFERYVQGKCTEREQAMVEAWYLDQLKQETQRPSIPEIRAAQKQVWSRLNQKNRRNPLPLRRWSAVAATVVIGILLIYRFDPFHRPVSTQLKEELTLRKSADSAKRRNPVTVLLASRVENTMMKLPDGSIVILEKGTRLSLFSEFAGEHEREVELEGKAFFDIAHNPARPFIIHSGNVQTKVLGTAFDITANPGSDIVKVNVIRGLVEVTNMKTQWKTLLPKNFQGVFDDNSKPVRRAVDAASELSWNQENLEFNDLSIADAKERLEARFGYKVIVTDPILSSATFTYSMRREEPMESFIKALTSFIGADFKIDHKNKTISIQPLNQ